MHLISGKIDLISGKIFVVVVVACIRLLCTFEHHLDTDPAWCTINKFLTQHDSGCMNAFLSALLEKMTTVLPDKLQSYHLS